MPADLLSLHNMFILYCKLFSVYWQDRHANCIVVGMDTRKGKNYQATQDRRGEVCPVSAGLVYLNHGETCQTAKADVLCFLPAPCGLVQFDRWLIDNLIAIPRSL